MAGFRIEYSGGAVQRKDVPQATGNSSLTQLISTKISPSTWDGNGSGNDLFLYGGVAGGDIIEPVFPARTQHTMYFLSGGPASTPWTTHLGNGTFVVYAKCMSNMGIAFVTPVLPNGGYIDLFTNQTGFRSFAIPANRAGFLKGWGWNPFGPWSSTIEWGTINSSGSGISYAGSVGTPNPPSDIIVDYIAVYENASSSVSINATTFTNGVNATGGSVVTPSVSTYQSGTGALSTPAKEFGLVLKHNGEVISDTKYLPPAQVSQSATATLHDQGIITATATTITAEGEGLGGSDKLRALDTRVMVEDYKDAVEY